MRSFWIAAMLLAASPAPATAQQPIDEAGTFVHPAAAHFPSRLGEFRRVNLFRYTPTDDNVSATYRLDRPDGQLIVTVYVYPSFPPEANGVEPSATESARERMCSLEFDGVGQAIRAQRKGAELVEEGGALLPDGADPTLVRRSVFHYVGMHDGREQALRSEADLYCYVDGRWQVKVRATSNIGFDAAAAIESVIRNGPWPGRPPPPDPNEIAARPAAAMPG